MPLTAAVLAAIAAIWLTADLVSGPFGTLPTGLFWAR